MPEQLRAPNPGATLAGLTATGVNPDAMASPAAANMPCLPVELRSGILSLLPPNDLALGGRLSSKDAAQRFSEPHHRTASLSQALPRHVAAAEATTAKWCLEAAQTALRELTFRRKLLLLSTAAASGCEANVEFALQLLQPHVFPELLHTDYYLALMQEGQPRQRRGELPPSPATHVGSAAVVSGLAHLLPSLVQRCPGLLDPGATLEAAARHCDLAGRRAAWKVLAQRLFSSLDLGAAGGEPGQSIGTDPQQQQDDPELHGVWRRVLSAAAGSPCPDAEAKMQWVLDTGRTHSQLAVGHAEAWGAAAASGDLARLRWLRERGFPWGGAEALAAALRHADLGFIVRMEQEGGCLPRAGDECWGSEAAVCAAAASARESAPKLLWLAARGAALGRVSAVQAAAARGDLEAVQLLVGHWRGQGAGDEGQEAGGLLPLPVMLSAVESGSVPTAAWLLQQGCGLADACFLAAFRRSDLPMVRWLLQAGCPRGELGINLVVFDWPGDTAADAEALVAAVQLLAAEGWPLESGEDLAPLEAAALRHPWVVWRALMGLGSKPAAEQLSQDTLCNATLAGCEATLEAVVEMHVPEVSSTLLEFSWYYHPVNNRDRGSLTRLRQLGVPLGSHVMVCAAEDGVPLFLLKWLVEQGAPFRGKVVEHVFRVLGKGYPAPCEQERQEVEGWLRGRLRDEPLGEGGRG